MPYMYHGYFDLCDFLQFAGLMGFPSTYMPSKETKYSYGNTDIFEYTTYEYHVVNNHIVSYNYDWRWPSEGFRTTGVGTFTYKSLFLDK